MSKNLFFAALLALLATRAFCGAAGAPLNVEDLPRSTYPGPNGVRVTIIRHADQNWTEIDAAAVLASKNSLLDLVCFEGKYEAILEPVTLKLTGIDGRVVFEDKAHRKNAPDMKSLDNVFVFGMLQLTKDGRNQEIVIREVHKLPPDFQRFQAKFDILDHDRNINGLIDLGRKIDQSMKNSKNGGGVGMIGFDRLTQLRDKSWALAISLKEKDVRPNDANATYEVATMYRDLMNRTPMYRTWVLKTLDIDPDHSNAGKDAERVFSMIRVGDKWMSKADYEFKQREQELNSKELVERQKTLERERTARRSQEIADRTVRLLEHQAALRSSNADLRVGAIKSFGEAIQNTLDLGFALQGVDILTNMNDPAAIVSGMDFAAKSEFIEVRQLVYASLAWRAGQNDVNSETAFSTLALALKGEKMKEPAQAASDALVEAGGKGTDAAMKGALSTLVAGLDSNESSVCEALMEGLKKLTHVQLTKKEEWIAWWNEKKNQTNAKSFENASVK